MALRQKEQPKWRRKTSSTGDSRESAKSSAPDSVRMQSSACCGGIVDAIGQRFYDAWEAVSFVNISIARSHSIRGRHFTR